MQSVPARPQEGSLPRTESEEARRIPSLEMSDSDTPLPRLKKIHSSEQALHEARLERELARLRAWRDKPGADRAFLFGHAEGREEPFFCVLLEKGERVAGKVHRGATDLLAAESARRALEAS